MKHYALSIAVLVLFGPPALRAEEPPDGAEPALPSFHARLEVSSVAASESEAGAVTVIDRRTIEALDARSAAELLRHAAGVHVLTAGGRGGASAQIRGGDLNFTLVLLDGVPLNNATDLQGGAVNLASLPASQIERIEVIRGPLSFFYGSSALAGVINVVTRRAGAPRRFEARLDAGGSLLRGAASSSGRSDRGDYYLGLAWEEDARRIAEDAFEQWNLQGSSGRRLGERGELRVSARLSRLEVADYPEASGGPRFGSGELRRSTSSELGLGADLALRPSDRRRHRLAATFYRQELARDSPAIFPRVPPSIEDTEYWRARLGWAHHLRLAPRLEVGAGADLEIEDGRNASTLLLPPFLGGETPGDYRVSRTTPGAFADLAVERGGLLVEVALRADLPEDAETQWSPRLGLRYRLKGRRTVVRASAGRSFKLPSFFALASPPALGGNPGLEAEESEAVDLGVERAAGNGWRIGVTLFAVRYRNLIDFDFETFSHVNRSRVEARGAELTLRWRDASAPASAGLDLTRQEVDDPDSPQPPLNQPEWLAAGWLSWRPRAAFELTLSGSYAGESLDVQIPVPERRTVEAYALLHVSASWSFSERGRLRLRVDNLTDAGYQHFIGFPEPGATARLGLRFVW